MTQEEIKKSITELLDTVFSNWRRIEDTKEQITELQSAVALHSIEIENLKSLHKPGGEPPPIDPPQRAQHGINVVLPGYDGQVFANLFQNANWVIGSWWNNAGFPSDPRIEKSFALIPMVDVAREPHLLTVQRGQIKIDKTTYGAGVHKIDLPETAVATVIDPGEFDLRGVSINQNAVFNPSFLEICKPFSVLRDLDWAKTNNSAASGIDDIVRRDHPCQASYGFGASRELLFDLCYEVGASPYVTLPHLASQSYLLEVAKMISEFQKKSNAPVYVEYSNEVWNGMFAQSKWATTEGMKSWPSLSQDEAKARWYGMRSTESLKFIESKCQGVKTVVAWQAASTRHMSIMKSTWGDWKPSCIAIAPYIHLPTHKWLDQATKAVHNGKTYTELNIEWQNAGNTGIHPDILAKSSLVDDHLCVNFDKQVLFDAIDKTGQGLDASNLWVKAYGDWCQAEGIELITYENGSHVIGPLGSNQPPSSIYSLPRWREVFYDVHRDDRWIDIYRKHHQSFIDAGGTVQIWYNQLMRTGSPGNRRGGDFGHLDYMSDVQSPKWKALMQFTTQAKQSGIEFSNCRFSQTN